MPASAAPAPSSAALLDRAIACPVSRKEHLQGLQGRQHNRVRYTCKDCGGAGICEHNRERRHCRDCGGQGMCAHSRVRSKCKDCKERRRNT